MSKLVRCDNCGAVMEPNLRDGRTYACAHCGSALVTAIDGGQIAAGMKLDLANVDAFLTELAAALRHGFGDQVVIVMTSGAIGTITLDLEPHRFVVKRDRNKLDAQVKQLVRGVALKTKKHALPEWVELLHRAIAEQLNANAALSETLARLQIK